MVSFDLFVIARALHILAIVLWIGGVAFVTTVFIPALMRLPDNGQRFALFETLEGRFSFQAKLSTALAGVTGVYMLEFLHAWDRYLSLQFWWLHLMTAIWVIFTLVLFVLEPLFLHRWFHELAERDNNKAFQILQRMHRVLLTLSLITVVGAMAGAHGFQYFS